MSDNELVWAPSSDMAEPSTDMEELPFDVAASSDPLAADFQHDGGPEKIVQIDKTKFGKGKYKKGQYNEAHWVLGLIEEGQRTFVWKCVQKI
ncbi:hypothetical protein K1T71_010058 [Dendrolimus kikuchii]|uniref:Uncharacterized protein n=1 Tax=Dendrolimus kikuchii TaxID=765133 RepID=A0ACC1CQS0_9NEOP|nr:hypothetical protein K1T71_010058 [Dendrolimus kikuchii]